MRLIPFMKETLILLGLILLCAPLYVRLAPIEAANYHRMVPTLSQGDTALSGGFHAKRAVTNPQSLSRLDAVIRSTPRTRVLDGSVKAGHISYVTRSLIWGFPDITNVWVANDTLNVHGHLVYGRSDTGVNQARIKGWLTALGQP